MDTTSLDSYLNTDTTPASDSGSWFSGDLATLKGLVPLATDIYKTFKPTPTTAVVKPTTAQTIGGMSMQTVMLIGAGVLTLVLVVLMVGRNK